MNALLSAYTSYDDAAKTVEELKHSGYNENEVAVVNRDDLINGDIHVKDNGKIERTEFALIILLGGVMGALLGTGTISIPHLHPVGLSAGIFTGLAFGCLMGAIVALLTNIIISRVNDVKYAQLLQRSRFLVFVQGSEEEIQYAERIAHTGNLHFELSSH